MDALEHILDEWEKDCNIDKIDIGNESIKIPKLHAKYIRILSKYKLLLKKAKNDFAEIKKVKWNYYSGYYNTNKEILEKLSLEPFKLILKQDISIYLETDKDLVEISNKITYYEEIISVCDKILSSLKNRSYEIRSYIDWVKYENGS